MRKVRRAGERLLDDRNPHGGEQLEGMVKQGIGNFGLFALPRRAPRKVGGKGVGAGLGRAERRDLPFGEQGEGALSVRREEGGERLGGALRAEDRLDRELRVELGRRADRGEHRVAPGKIEQAVEYFGVLLRCRRHGQVDDRRIGIGRCRLDAVQSKAVRHRGGAAAGRGEDRDARRAPELRRPAAGDEGCDLDKRLEQIDAQDAAIAEERIERGVQAGERAGVRARKRFAERGAPELVGDDRLSRGVRLARCGSEPIGVAHRLEKQQDHARLGVLHQQLDQLADTEVGLVADRHQLREAEAVRRAARQHRAEHRAALRDEARRPRGRRIDLEHRVHAERHAAGQIDDPHAVRAEEAHAERLGARHEPRLALRAFAPRVGEAVAVDRSHRDAAPAAVLDRLLDALDHDKGVVDALGHLRAGGFAKNFLSSRVHRDDASGIAMLPEEALRSRGILLLVAGSADERHGAGRKQRLC